MRDPTTIVPVHERETTFTPNQSRRVPPTIGQRQLMTPSADEIRPYWVLLMPSYRKNETRRVPQRSRFKNDRNWGEREERTTWQRVGSKLEVSQVPGNEKLTSVRRVALRGDMAASVQVWPIEKVQMARRANLNSCTSRRRSIRKQARISFSSARGKNDTKPKFALGAEER
jgi:hypothetical protein